MIDRHGKPIAVGWSEHELVWLRAAMSLPFGERMAAFHDIADTTGRTVAAIKHQEYVLDCIARSCAHARSIRQPITPWLATSASEVPPPRPSLTGAPIREVAR